jgi:hypothetical protein
VHTGAVTAKYIRNHCFPVPMTDQAVFTKRIGHSRLNYVVWIPKDVSMLLRLKSGDILEVRIRKLRGDAAS